MNIEIRPFRPGDEEAILACWNRIFPVQAQGSIPQRRREVLEWYFLDNPVGGEPRIMLAWDGDRVVGQYAGCPYRAILEGRGEVTVVQAVDLMVDPAYRRVNLPLEGDQVVHFTDLVRRGWQARPKRPGLFVHLGRRYYERWCGVGKDLMTYGYAVPAWRIGNKYLGYEMVDSTTVLYRELTAPLAAAPTLTVTEVDGYDAGADRLWQELAGGFRFALIRDRAYLNWRYRDHPDRPYRLFQVGDDRGLRGLAVMRTGDFIVPGIGLLADWLVAPGDREAALALLGRLEEVARQAGAPGMAALFPTLDPWFLDFQQLGYQARGTSYNLGVVTFHRDAAWLRERWYYTLGDSDLV